MTSEELIRAYPSLYHMAAEGSWPSIRRLGLLSTSRLVSRFEVREPLRSEVLSGRRRQSYVLRHPRLGSAVVRDQLPLNEAVLQRVLVDMDVAKWLEMLNSRVFFWPTAARLDAFLRARAYRERAHDCLELDTSALLQAHGSGLTLSAINSGSTIYNARPRGAHTFLPIDVYPFEARRRVRGLMNAVAEIAVADGIVDVERYVVRVERRQGAELLERLFDCRTTASTAPAPTAPAW